MRSPYLVWRSRLALYAFQQLENPISLIVGSRSRPGRPGEIRFRSGLRFEISPGVPGSDRATALKLLWLSARGAHLVPGEPGWLEWGVDQSQGTITTPQGLRFTLDSLDPDIFYETFITQTHFEPGGFNRRVVVDAGGFVGDTALYFAQLGAEVFTFEPDPQNLQRLKANLRLNACGDRVRVVPKAVGVDGTIPFRVGAEGGSQGYVNPRVSNYEVESVSLDTIVRDLPPAPFLLKADIKGAEYEIVSQPGLTAFERIQIEYSPRPGRSSHDLVSRLEDRGFRGTVYKHGLYRNPLSQHGTIRMEKGPGLRLT